MELTGNNASELWGSVFRAFKSNRTIVADSRVGKTVEIPQVVLHLSDPRQRWVTNRNPGVSIAFSLAEVVWILNRSDDAKVINFWNPSLPKYSGDSDQYPGAYGQRLGKEFGFDQLERAYQALKNNPSTRQVVLTYYDPCRDFPFSDGLPRTSDIPCNVVSMLKIRDGRLNWTQIMRSNDIIRGLPYNLVQFTTLQEIMAGWLGVEAGVYTHFSDSLHFYESDRNNFSLMDSIPCPNSDSLCMSKSDFDYWLPEMYSRMVRVSHMSTSPAQDELDHCFSLGSSLQALDNIMFVLGAYVAKKHGFVSLENEFIRRCTNQLFGEMWTRWSAH